MAKQLIGLEAFDQKLEVLANYIDYPNKNIQRKKLQEIMNIIKDKIKEDMFNDLTVNNIIEKPKMKKKLTKLCKMIKNLN